MNKNDYIEKLKDPRWQKKRLEIFQRDGFACQICGDNKSSLCVHHKRYFYKTEPWEYPDELLITLCNDCHEKETAMMQETINTFGETIKGEFLSSEVDILLEAFNNIKMIHHEGVIACTIRMCLTDATIMQMLVDMYFEHLKKLLSEKEKKDIPKIDTN